MARTERSPTMYQIAEAARLAGVHPERFLESVYRPLACTTEFVFKSVPMDDDVAESMGELQAVFDDPLRCAVFKAAVPELCDILIRLTKNMKKAHTERYVRIPDEEMRKMK